MPFDLTAKDKANLKGVHPHLRRMIVRAAKISPVRFRVIEGRRTVARQKQLVARGASKTMNSRHLTGHAVDVVPLVDANRDGKVSSAEMWAWPAYYKLAPFIKQAARMEGVPAEWGGDWRTFKDGPHWQLPWKKYPAGKDVPEAARAAAPIEDVTEQTAAKREAAAIGAAGATGTSTVAVEPVQEITDAISSQQYELSSGSMIRMGLALVIVGLSLYLMWPRIKTILRG